MQVAGSILREMETSRTQMTGSWLGNDLVELMGIAGKFFERLGGYPLPKRAKL